MKNLDNNKLFKRYLKILGLREEKPDYDYLQGLVLAHLTRVPFENISKIYYKKTLQLCDIPDLELYLEGIEKYNFGGTCYSNNYYFHLLLSHLGFDVKLCGADMQFPDVHIANIVTFDGKEYIVDGGYAAPFLIPIPRYLNSDFEISLGSEHYVLKPVDSYGRSKMEQYRNGDYIHGYLLKPEPRNIGDFKNIILGSFREEAVFFNSILLTRFYPDRSTVIHNLNLVESSGTDSKTSEIKDTKKLVCVIKEKFGIPKSISEAAISEIKELKNPWE